MSWTTEHDDRLKTLIGRSMKFTAIAATLNKEFQTSYTKNACIGRARRKGFVTQRPAGKAQSETIRQTFHSGPRAPRRPPTVNPLTALLALPPSEPHSGPLVALLDLEPHHCRFIPGEPSAGFCGAPKAPGLSYCAHHAQRCWMPLQARTRSEVRPMPGPAPGTGLFSALKEFEAA